MKTVPIINLRTHSAIGLSIRGDHSGTAVHASNEAIELFGSIDEAFHRIKALQSSKMLPRMGSASRPISLRDLELAGYNILLNQRRFVFNQITHGREFWSGYGYKEGNFFVFIRADNSVRERVRL